MKAEQRRPKHMRLQPIPSTLVKEDHIGQEGAPPGRMDELELDHPIIDLIAWTTWEGLQQINHRPFRS